MLWTGRQRFAAGVLACADPTSLALADDARHLTYEDLSRCVAERAGELDLATRSLVVLEAANSIEFIVTYLAVQVAGHVPLLAGSHTERLAAAWRPAAVVRTHGSEVEIEHRSVAPSALHPHLALLLSTSGSTGAPKLVRLSDRNLLSNAEAIVSYLGITADDRAITSLPLHYCYGLSVLHSHLAAGAAVVVTGASVVDPCFAQAMGDHGVTSMAGVPHTYDLLERAGPERIRVPTLRLLTQAGGRLAPDRVEQWARRAESWGAALYVMYGQTEATARMAYLPPRLARRRPAAIGVPIPGGHLELVPADGLPADVGELVYRGPNVMMGYATDQADLALGATTTELRTGDIARFHADDGVFEIVGRRARFVKPFGVRVDLDEIEQALCRCHGEVAVTGDDEHVVVVAPGADADEVRRSVRELAALPAARVVVDDTGPVPRTSSGKVDYDAVRRRTTGLGATGRPTDDGPACVASIYADVLGRQGVAPTSTFIALGGDSLSYVECSLRLERALGQVPADWHVRTVEELEAGASRRRKLPRFDTTVILRAVGICTIVATHMHVTYFPGGAHLLLALVGFNLSRFQLPIAATAERLRAGLRTAARAAIPVTLWVGIGMLLVGGYSAGTLLLANNYVGPRTHREGRWHFWFIEVFVHLTVLTTLLLAVPAVRRLERRFPFGFPLLLFLACIALRVDWSFLGDPYNLRFRTHGVAWFFVLGWLIHRSGSWWQRLLTSMLCVLTIPGFFDRSQREWYIAGCLLALVWFRDVPFPRLAMRPVATVAAATMWILITHFRVWPPLDRALDRQLAYVLTIVVGVLAWAAAERIMRAARPFVARARRPGRPTMALRPALD